ncbi:MAG: hypothetical protein ACRDHP_18160 [Ktedonobacterales bacterium]
MDGPPPAWSDATSDPGDEFEVSDLHAESAGSPSHVGFMRRPSLSPRQRMRSLAIASGSVLLALLILIASAPGLRAGAGAWLASLKPRPTAALPPGADRFYFSPSIPTIQLAIDDHPVSPPRIGLDPPLVLAHGIHHISWRADPYFPQSCVVSVPLSASNTCGNPASIYQSNGRVAANVFLLRESLATLLTDQRAAVLGAMNRSLANFTDSVLPGDHYVGFQVATAPLRARLTVSLTASLDNLDSAETNAACLPASAAPFVTCAGSAAVCAYVCTIPTPILTNAGIAVPPASWFVLVYAYLSWTITAPNGQMLVSGGSFSPGVALYAILFALTRDGAAWHAQPYLGAPYSTQLPRLNASGSIPTSPLLGEVGCAAMPDFVGSNPGIPSAATITYLAAPQPATGCLAVVTDGPATQQTHPAYYLYRFGAVTAVNDTAHRQISTFPVASARERQIAASILSAGAPTSYP